MLSVILASHNGSSTLSGVLKSLLIADQPQSEYEVIVVDNASTDDTVMIAKGFADSLPLTVLSEPRQGKNVALNLALSHAKGDLLVFTDDDVVLPKNILTGYESLAARESTYSLFGGHVVARYQSVPDERILNEIPVGIA